MTLLLRPMMSIALENKSDIIRALTKVQVKDDKLLLLEAENTSSTSTYDEDNEKINTGNTQDWDEEDQTPKERDATHESRMLLKNRTREFLRCAWNCIQSHTAALCYFAFVVNLIYSPNIYNIWLTISALLYAGQQNPYPSKTYWEIVLYYTMFMTIFEYVVYLIQNAVTGTDISNEYSSLQFLGWSPSTTLLQDVIMYLFVMLAIFIHRDALKKRGEWVGIRNPSKNKIDPLTLTTPRIRSQDVQEENKDVESDENISASTEDNENKSIRRRGIKLDRPAATMNEQGNVIPLVKDKDDKDSYEEHDIKIKYIQKMYDTIKINLSRYYSDLTTQERKIGFDLYVMTNLTHIVGLVFFACTYNYITGNSSENITSGISSNQLSGTFVLLLFVFFIEICVERVLYLKSSLRFKVLFHFVQVIGYHVGFLVVYDYVQYNSNNVGRILLGVFFFIKCFSMWLSAVQIKNGYPAVGTYSQFFARGYGFVYSTVYSIWRAIPFVFELKAILDWTFIGTTLSFNDWFKMEDIYRSLYSRKCELVDEKKEGRKFGEKKAPFKKCTNGFILFAVLCLVVFFPLAFYSTINPSINYNAVNDIDTQVTIRGFESMYEGGVDLNDIPSNNDYPYINAATLFSNVSFTRREFVEFDPSQKMQVFRTDLYSDSLWTISEPSRDTLAYRLLRDPNNTHVNLAITIKIGRVGPTSNQDVSLIQFYPLTNTQRVILSSMVSAPYLYADGKSDVLMNGLYNPYLLNKYDGIYSSSAVDPKWYPDCTMGIRVNGENSTKSTSFYWSIRCDNPSFTTNNSLSSQILSQEQTDQQNAGGLYFWIQSTEIVTSTNSITSLISGVGIIAFYTTFVLAIGNFVRGFTSGSVGTIFYSDLDSVDLLLSYVMDIYLARECKDTELEEMMFDHLLNIYRDTTLIQIWSEARAKI
ncbi:hypothetical protein AKO1_008348 [Acrasis kona]|uniref:Piezo non-specific cation channel R-Ras-binding domain-containing protein n=1 Tax=Acrasis kona TaxID=1008807 RepID=A0AAW2YN02_9EUKA